ncbi:hypothetical protein Tco_0504507, partial [Tanacetum coccineum]
EDHADYPADGGDGDDEPSDDDDDDDDADDEDEEASEDEDDDEEEEHLAPADSSTVPIVDHVPSARDTEAFETDESAHLRLLYHPPRLDFVGHGRWSDLRRLYRSHLRQRLTDFLPY